MQTKILFAFSFWIFGVIAFAQAPVATAPLTAPSTAPSTPPTNQAEVFSVYPDVDDAIKKSFSGQDDVIHSLLERFYFMKMLQLSINDDSKWEVYRKRYWEALYCSQFVIGNSPESNQKVEQLKALLLQKAEMKDYDKNEIEKLMTNRELRRRTFKDYDGVPAADKHRFCKFPLKPDFVQKRKAEMGSAETASIKETMKLEDLHPTLRTVMQGLLKAQVKDGLPTRKQLDDTMMILITQILPILETKAQLEFLPEVNKKCPGFVDQMWKVCESNPNAKYPKGMFPDTSKMLCAQDHRSESPIACRSLLAVPDPAQASAPPSTTAPTSESPATANGSNLPAPVAQIATKLSAQMSRITTEPLTKGNVLSIGREIDRLTKCLSQKTQASAQIVLDLKTQIFQTEEAKKAWSLFENKLKSAPAHSRTATNPKCE